MSKSFGRVGAALGAVLRHRPTKAQQAALVAGLLTTFIPREGARGLMDCFEMGVGKTYLELLLVNSLNLMLDSGNTSTASGLLAAYVTRHLDEMDDWKTVRDIVAAWDRAARFGQQAKEPSFFNPTVSARRQASLSDSVQAQRTLPIHRSQTVLVITDTTTRLSWDDNIRNHCGNDIMRTLVFEPAKMRAEIERQGSTLYDDLFNKSHYTLVFMTYTTLGTLANDYCERLKTPSTSGVTKEDPLFMFFKVEWRSVILDEAHMIRSATSRGFKGAMMLHALAYRPVSGSMINNQLTDMTILMCVMRYAHPNLIQFAKTKFTNIEARRNEVGVTLKFCTNASMSLAIFRDHDTPDTHQSPLEADPAKFLASHAGVSVTQINLPKMIQNANVCWEVPQIYATAAREVGVPGPLTTWTLLRQIYPKQHSHALDDLVTTMTMDLLHAIPADMPRVESEKDTGLMIQRAPPQDRDATWIRENIKIHAIPRSKTLSRAGTGFLDDVINMAHLPFVDPFDPRRALIRWICTTTLPEQSPDNTPLLMGLFLAAQKHGTTLQTNNPGIQAIQMNAKKWIIENWPVAELAMAHYMYHLAEMQRCVREWVQGIVETAGKQTLPIADAPVTIAAKNPKKRKRPPTKWAAEVLNQKKAMIKRQTTLKTDPIFPPGPGLPDKAGPSTILDQVLDPMPRLDASGIVEIEEEEEEEKTSLGVQGVPGVVQFLLAPPEKHDSASEAQHYEIERCARIALERCLLVTLNRMRKTRGDPSGFNVRSDMLAMLTMTQLLSLHPDAARYIVRTEKNLIEILESSIDPSVENTGVRNYYAQHITPSDKDARELFFRNSYTRCVSSKMRFFEKYLRINVKPDEKVIIYSRYAVWILILQGYIEDVLKKKTMVLKSYRDSTARQRVIADFRAAAPLKGEASILFVMTRGNSCGINLTSANHGFVFDPWYNPRLDDQALARIHRIGQTRYTMRGIVLLRDSYEYAIYLLGAEKAMIGYNISGMRSHQRRHLRVDTSKDDISIESIRKRIEMGEMQAATADGIEDEQSSLFNISRRTIAMQRERSMVSCTGSGLANGTRENESPQINDGLDWLDWCDEARRTNPLQWTVQEITHATMPQRADDDSNPPEQGSYDVMQVFRAMERYAARHTELLDGLLV